MHGLARPRQPEREQITPGQLARQVDPHIPEVHLGLGPGLVALLDEDLRRRPARLQSDLRAALCDVVADHPVRHLHRAVFLQQPVEDALGGVPLLRRRVKIHPQHLVDQRLERIQPRRAGRQRLTRLGPDRGQRLLHRAEAHVVLALDGSDGQPRSRIAADRRIQLDLGLGLHQRHLIPRSTSMLPPQALGRCYSSATSPCSGNDRCRSRPSNAVTCHRQNHPGNRFIIWLAAGGSATLLGRRSSWSPPGWPCAQGSASAR